MRIVKAELAQLEEVAILFDAYRQFYKQKPDLNAARSFIQHRMEKEQSIILLVEIDGRFGGFTQLYPSFSSVNMQLLWILNDLYVHPDFRRQGLGEKLINGAKYLAEQSGALGLQLETNPDNTQAQKLYDKTGFVKESNYFYHWKK